MIFYSSVESDCVLDRNEFGKIDFRDNYWGFFSYKTIVFNLVLLIDPLKGAYPVLLAHLTVLNYLPHLSV